MLQTYVEGTVDLQSFLLKPLLSIQLYFLIKFALLLLIQKIEKCVYRTYHWRNR